MGDVIQILTAMEGGEPQAAEVVKLRFFVGLNQTQIAEILDVSRCTADSRWALAQAWLSRTMRSEA